MTDPKNDANELHRRLRTLDAEFERQMRARGFDPAQAENIALPSTLATLYAERETTKAQLEELAGGTMTEIERILDQLKRAYEGNAWHGPSVREALEGVTAEQAHTRPLQNAHTIWELAHHIAVWENAVRRRLEGDRAQIALASSEDWPPISDQSEAAWEQSKAALDRGHRELRDAIARVPESRLDEPILEGMSTVYVTLHGIIQHNLYHAGQISMLKKALN